jgi:CTD small phosphatase-like protein 2
MTNWASLLFFPAPPKFKTSHGRRKTLCLDLDETLVHTNAVFETLEGHLPPTLRLDVENNSNRHSSSKNRIFYVRIRPHLSVFLKECMKLFEVVVFTASEKSYADPIIASIFHEADCNIPRQCYYRPSCDAVMGMHIKDLSKVRHDLSKVILLDNSTSAAAYQPTNLMTISSWYGAENDTELLDTLELLKVLSTVSDVRNILNLRLSQRIEQVSMTSG